MSPSEILSTPWLIRPAIMLAAVALLLGVLVAGVLLRHALGSLRQRSRLGQLSLAPTGRPAAP